MIQVFNRKRGKLLLTLVSLLILETVMSQQNYRNESPLTLEEIMKGNDFVGHQPENHRFLPDGNLLFDWKKLGDSISRTYILNCAKATYRPLEKNELTSFPMYDVVWHHTKTFCVYLNNGNLYKWNIKSQKPQLIWSTRKPISDVFTVQNPDCIYFQQQNNVFKITCSNATFELIQVTHFVESINTTITEKSWLEKQQLELFDYHSKKNNNNKEKEVSDTPKAVEIGKNQISNISISPDEKFITFSEITYNSSNYTHYMDYLDASGYAKNKLARPKVGREEDKHKIGVYKIENDTVIYFDQNDLKNINDVPKYYSDYGKTDYKHKGVVFHTVKFSANSQYAVVESKSLDNKHRWIAQLEFKNNKLVTLVHQHDEAWIGGPGISGWNEQSGTLEWLPDNQTIFYQSEKNGFSHLYTYSLTTNKESHLTDGKFEIYSAQLSKDGKKIYVTANKTHPGNRGFYQLDLTTKKLNAVFEKDGYYNVIVAPQETHLCYLYSYKNKPWELFGCENSLQPKNIVQITNSLTNHFKEYSFRAPDVIQIKAKDGQLIHARIYEPEKSKKNGAAVLFVHGAGYLQNAHNYWSTYHREYMFHNFLTDNGYTVLDMDYRGSEGYGRDWRTGIYRHMGGKDLSDYVDGRNYLISKLNIDSTRIGIYGGSYGGFITLMALFTEPGKFKCGAALRSVTDWAHYNHEYTSNILNTPQEDENAYKKSSPIYYAQNLKDRLLILHGILDDNVQYQDVVRLSQRLIELQKDNWELASYPIEPHGFKSTTSWIDEYKRIYKLFEEELNSKK